MKTTDCTFGIQYKFYARVTIQGLSRLPSGCHAGDIFQIHNLSPGQPGDNYWCAHVVHQGSIWSLCKGDWEIANEPVEWEQHPNRPITKPITRQLYGGKLIENLVQATVHNWLSRCPHCDSKAIECLNPESTIVSDMKCHTCLGKWSIE